MAPRLHPSTNEQSSSTFHDVKRPLFGADFHVHYGLAPNLNRSLFVGLSDFTIIRGGLTSAKKIHQAAVKKVRNAGGVFCCLVSKVDRFKSTIFMKNVEVVPLKVVRWKTWRRLFLIKGLK